MGRKTEGRVKKAPSLAALILASVAGAWSADVIVERAPSFLAAPAPAGRDATMELAWDNGRYQYFTCWYSGNGVWAGNDFDVATISTSIPILKYKFHTRSDWPNEGWDGVGVGFYNFAGGIPGSVVWPTSGKSHFFKPSGGAPDFIWAECDVHWRCPFTKFLAAHDQIYNYPQCDPCAVDDNYVFRGHSWCYWDRWMSFKEMVGLEPYHNLMIRVVVDDTTAVAPTSLGRVKALYY
jgi:hypothetical protein